MRFSFKAAFAAAGLAFFFVLFDQGLRLWSDWVWNQDIPKIWKPIAFGIPVAISIIIIFGFVWGWAEKNDVF